ncbi:MAG: type II secretion system protein GspM [Pseudomonadota bacterium]
MSPSAIRPASRIVAWGALLALLALLVWIGFSAIGTVRSARAAINISEENIVALEKRISDQTAQTADRDPGLLLALRAQDETLAGAELQDHVVETLQSFGVVPASVEIRFPEPAGSIPGDLRLVVINTQFQSHEGDLPAMLQAFETGSPLAHVATLSIFHASGSAGEIGAADGWRPLSIEMTINGYWRPGDA